MKSYKTVSLFALAMSADKFAKAAYYNIDEGENNSIVEGDGGCVDTTEQHVFDVELGCCHLYTEPYFGGDKFEVCNENKPLPPHFVLEGIDSWVCGKHS